MNVLRRLSIIIGIAGLMLGLMAGVANAASPTVYIPKTATILGTAFDTAAIVGYAVGTLLPLVVAFFVGLTTSTTVKGILNLFFAAVTAVLTQVVSAINNHTDFQWQAVVIQALITFAIGVLTYLHIWKSPVATHIQANYGFVGKRSAAVNGQHEG